MFNNNNFSSFLPNRQNLFIWLNAITLFIGLLLLDWRPAIIVFAYVFETIIIGIIHVFKLWSVFSWGTTQKNTPVSKDPRQMNGFGFIPFFIAHYFFFIFVQSVFIFSFMGSSIPGINNDGFDVLRNYKTLLSQTDMQLAFASIAITNTAFATRNFFIPQRYHDFTMQQLFMQPYIRIIVQQFVSILAGFFFFFVNNGLAVAIVLIIVRTVIDLYLSALKKNSSLRNKLIEKLNQSNKSDKPLVTEQQLDLFLE